MPTENKKCLFFGITISLITMMYISAASAEIPADVQDREEAMQVDAAISYGRRMSKTEVDSLENSLQLQPDDLKARARLLGYYFYQGVKLEGRPATVKARRRHITWLISHYSNSRLMGRPEATIDPSGHAMADKIGYETGSSMWRALVEQDDVTQRTMEHAYNFLRLNDKAAAEKIALKAKSPYMIGEIYALGVSRVTMMNQNGFVLAVGTSREDESYAVHAVEALRATNDKTVLEIATYVLLTQGAIAQVMSQRGGEMIEPAPVAFAGELLGRCSECRSQGHYYKLMAMISKTPEEKKKYAQAELAFLEREADREKSAKSGNSPVPSLMELSEQAKAAFEAGELDKAADYASQTLQGVAEQPLVENYGSEIHAAHIVLGRVSLRKGDVKDAGRQLLAAANVKGSPVLNSFGPNMTLAKELLERGERETVITYLKQCRSFWDKGQESLTHWIATIEKGGMPEFGANLNY